MILGLFDSHHLVSFLSTIFTSNVVLSLNLINVRISYNVVYGRISDSLFDWICFVSLQMCFPCSAFIFNVNYNVIYGWASDSLCYWICFGFPLNFSLHFHSFLVLKCSKFFLYHFNQIFKVTFMKNVVY